MTAAFETAPTAEAAVPEHGTVAFIPLNRLKKSPRNARKTPHSAADIEALAASTREKGILQPPVVEPELGPDGQPTGDYLVTIGEGRRLSQLLRAKRKEIRKTQPIRCVVDTAHDAFEISLDENVTRFAMHPADQFEAFRDLADNKGWGAEEIGARFGVSPTLVRRRMRLGAVSPVLMAAYRTGDLTLDQLMAFAVSEDHARQEQVFAGLSWNRSPTFIRRMMTEHEVEASDRRARYVGVEAYEAAGGTVRRDLFSEDGSGWFADAALLDRMALEKLAAEAEAVRAAEGWRWAEGRLDHPYDHGCRRVYPRVVEPDAETQARLDALAEEYDAIVASCGEDECLTEEQDARLTEIDAELAAARPERYDPEAVARGGLFAVLAHEGVRIERGFIRPEDEAQAETEPDAGSGRDDDAEREADAPDDQADRTETRKTLSERLVADLTAHRTAALRDALAEQPQAAFLAALHALTLQTFYCGGETCLDLQIASLALEGHAEGLAETAAGRALEARHALWAGQLPDDPEALLAALQALPDEGRLALFAHVVSLGVNAVQRVGTSRRALAHAGVLAELVGLDMGRYWTVTASSYLGRVTKALIAEAVAEGVSPEAAGPLVSLDKASMAAKAEDLLKDTGWLPPLLRRSGAAPE
ncbi:ParB/RepB/Spo0J family partition protein [Brevundimonas sp.]|uniref:ParB/RepB/Spo0J family partition protein n=1 Tax=Brevundimonas sp. TaxID=1871086 RepID=UPI002D50828B|nr:ParB N-terminal domain-containing protein [Brevundimonas sp.]HYC74673.1 ParB N-terminal domain-containing protein [Brevundimonas sp.]